MYSCIGILLGSIVSWVIYKNQVIPIFSKDYITKDIDPYFKPGEQRENDEYNGKDKLNSIYVAIMDRSYKAEHYHCLVKKQWINNLIDEDSVDSVEFYSLNSWENKECNINSVTVKQPPVKMADPSSWQLYQMMKMYLERTHSNWLFLIGDATYVNVHGLVEKFEHIINSRKGDFEMYARGSCIEYRYFFQMYQIEAGLFISRKAVQMLLEKDEYWTYAIQMEMEASQALGHALDSIGSIPPHNNQENFYGNRFLNNKDYERLLKHNFDDLPDCELRKELNNPPIGKNGNCDKGQHHFNELITWAGGGSNNKTWFMENAEKMLAQVPESVGIMWDGIYPRLCNYAVNYIIH